MEEKNVVNVSIISAKEARKRTVESNFFKKFLDKIIKQAAARNERKIMVDGSYLDEEILNGILAELESLGYKVYSEDPEDEKTFWITW